MKIGRRRHGDFHKFIMVALLKKGPLSLEELKRLTAIVATQFEVIGSDFSSRIASGLFSRIARPVEVRSSKPQRKKDEPEVNVELECNILLMKNLLILNEDKRYQLTKEGEIEARQFSEKIGRTTEYVEKQFLCATAATRNTVIIDFFLAVMKLTAGFLGGSIGLISDGADASIDTISASVSWIGLKLKREALGALITISMMFVAGVSILYESVTRIYEAVTSTIPFLSQPLLVIGVELVALACAAFLFLYQRYTGKRNGSLTLISQSVDSKNHIYVSMMVIIGALFSIFGVPIVDALVGAFVAMRILIDAFSLSKRNVLVCKRRRNGPIKICNTA